ncbi:MAG: site-2 protease family protein [archaeon]
MVSFWIYDVTFLVLFSIFIVWFLVKTRRKLSREGIMFIYRTQAGVNLIKWFGKKFSGILHSIKYLIIGVGFVLMGMIIWMLGQTLSIYILNPEITQVIKAPPIAPLIPYFPKLFGMSSFFPPFYFIYFIVALAIVAIVHEFSHGIYMKLFNIKIKSTGIVFLGPILGAFVEQGEKSFKSKSKTEQMTVLGAGVFANLLFALIFYGLYVAFFFSSFTASGYIFTSYGLTTIPLESITGFEDAGNLTKVFANNETYYIDEGLSVQRGMVNLTQMIVYPEAPAVLARMGGAIVQADNVRILNHESLRKFLETKEPGDVVTFVTETAEGRNEYELTLAEHPEDSSKAYLGVGHNEPNPRGFIQKFLSSFMSFKESSTYYKPSWDGEFVLFILHFLWWIMIINLLVALFNMLPLGILDGGRFFYLTIWGIFGNEDFAKKAYKFIGWAIFLVFLLMMLYWGIGIF